MRDDLIRIIDLFGSELSKHENNQYIPKLRDYFIDYLIENKSYISSIEELFKFEFTKADIFQSTEYYVVKNQNVKSKSAIDDFLIALNRFFEEVINKKYPNQNLICLRPFSNLNKEIENVLLKKGMELEDRKAYPPIKENHYKFIMEYMRIDKDKSFKTQQVQIVIKLLLLYGFSFDRIINLKWDNYCSETRTLEIIYNTTPKRSFKLELPYTLNNEIFSYMHHLDNSKNKSEFLFVTRSGNQIKHGFISNYLSDIKEAYYSENKLDIYIDNPFTPTGLAKYAVINMILDGVNHSVVSDLTGFMQDTYSDCQDIVNETKLPNRNRYINHMLRGISTFDEV